MSTTPPPPATRYEVYRLARDRRQADRGGKYKPASLTDACERTIAAEEPGVAMARETRLRDFEKVSPW